MSEYTQDSDREEQYQRELDEARRVSANQQEGGKSSESPTDKIDRSRRMVRGAATAGQVAGRTTQVVSKGAEAVAKGGEVASRAVKQGGQRLVQAGGRLSGTGVGAIAGIPMMVAGGAMTAGGAVGEVASKGAQKAAQTSGQLGQRVAEGSRRVRRGAQSGQGLPFNMNSLAMKASSGSGGAGGLGGGEGKGPALPSNVGRILALRKGAGGVKGAAQDAVNTGVSMATAQALAWSWRALIFTFGLTVFYINFHFVAKYIAHSEKFCAFGEEWGLGAVAGGAGAKAPGMSEGKGMLEIVEIGGMLLVDFLVAALLTIIWVLMYYISNPIEAVKLFGGGASGGAGASGGF